MTRMIDADALIKDCANTVIIAERLNEQDISRTFSAMLNTVLSQPTIDAIPIEYMQSQVDSGKWEEIITRWREHDKIH